MKTKYLAEGQLALFRKAFDNQYLMDIYGGYPYIGLLSALPLSTGDGVDGMEELFDGVSIGGYSRLPLSTSLFTSGNLTYSTELAASGWQVEYNGQIIFNPATQDWGPVVGAVIFYARVTPEGTLRITPMLSLEFVSPQIILTNQRIVIPNNTSAKMRIIELIRKQLLQT